MMSCLCGCTLHLELWIKCCYHVLYEHILMFNASKWVLSCGKIFEVFSILHQCFIYSNPRVKLAKTICRYWQFPSSFHSHQMKWCNVPHTYEIFMTRGMHHYTVKTIKEAAASCTLMLAMPMFYSDSKNGNVATSYWNTAKGTEYK